MKTAKNYKNYLKYVFVSPIMFLFLTSTSCKPSCLNKTNKIISCFANAKWLPKAQKYFHDITMGHKPAAGKTLQNILAKLFPHPIKINKIDISKKSWKIFSKGKI